MNTAKMAAILRTLPNLATKLDQEALTQHLTTLPDEELLCLLGVDDSPKPPKPAKPRSETIAASQPVNDEILQQVFGALRSSVEAVSAIDLALMTGLEIEVIKEAICQLIEANTITRIGKARGTKYTVAT